MGAYSRIDATPLDLAVADQVVLLPRASRRPPALTILLWLIALTAIIVPAVIVRFGASPPRPYDLLVSIPGHAVAELPPVDPVEMRSLSLDDARTFNAGVPFSSAANPAARPYRFVGAAGDLARATDCLAAGVYYEAGDDPAGERAVAQVVLNRVRHPAFPKTVCGVVFQGSERTTGCQFTFACDGALARYTPTPDGWRRASALAAAALAGAVERSVGYATHYHTDWVVPYWQSSLDKIVAVHTQLFYRWAGWWGTPAAFDRHALVGEPVVPALARLSDAHRPDVVAVTPGIDATVADDPSAGPVDQARLAEVLGQFLVTLPAGLSATQWPAYADRLCGPRPRCRVMAWRDKAQTATTLPLELTQIAAMDFSYVRDRASGIDRPLWNCRDARRPDPHQCMKRQMLMMNAPASRESDRDAMPAAPVGDQPFGTTAQADLAGVHRKAPASSAPIVPGDPKTGRPARITPPGTSPAAAP